MSTSIHYIVLTYWEVALINLTKQLGMTLQKLLKKAKRRKKNTLSSHLSLG
jgi:hypothetical protein